MKKMMIFAAIIGILGGALLVFFVIRDGAVSIPEGIACFAYLAIARVIGTLAIRSYKKAEGGSAPHSPANESGVIRALPARPAHGKAA